MSIHMQSKPLTNARKHARTHTRTDEHMHTNQTHPVMFSYRMFLTYAPLPHCDLIRTEGPEL
jgi:hypothetical protein